MYCKWPNSSGNLVTVSASGEGGCHMQMLSRAFSCPIDFGISEWESRYLTLVDPEVSSIRDIQWLKSTTWDYMKKNKRTHICLLEIDVVTICSICAPPLLRLLNSSSECSEAGKNGNIYTTGAIWDVVAAPSSICLLNDFHNVIKIHLKSNYLG